MPKIDVGGVELFFDEAGAGPETVVFAHSLLFSGRMFDGQVHALKDRYRCVTFDFRGQGRSQVTANGYDMETLSDDAAKIIEKLHCAPCHFLGFSMGGFVGIRLAARRPELIKSLILTNTSAGPEPKEKLRKYRLLNVVARRVGPWAVARYVMPIMFSQRFLRDPGRAEERRRWRQQLIGNDRIGVTRAVSGVVNRQGVYDELRKIQVPTLIIAGQHDTATPPDNSEHMHEAIAGSRLVIIPGSGHMTPVEAPGEVNRALLEFLDGL